MKSSKNQTFFFSSNKMEPTFFCGEMRSDASGGLQGWKSTARGCAHNKQTKKSWYIVPKQCRKNSIN